MKRILKFLLFFGLIAATSCSFQKEAGSPTNYEVFSLTKEELQSLRNPTSPLKITTAELLQLDEMVREVIKKSPPLENGDSNRLFAYLYNAQKAFVEESYAITGSFSGNLYPISLHVLQLFYPSYQGNPSATHDSFSEELTALLAKKVDARFKGEQVRIRPIAIQGSENSWQIPAAPFGLKISSMRPWILSRPSEFRSPKPPPPTDDKFWQDQLAQVKRAGAQLTEYRKKRVLFWADLPTPDPKADWKTVVQDYMTDREIPLVKQLEVRAQVATVMLDALIAAFDTKYTYLVRRPNMLDPSFEPYIPTPPHPSYPAGHSVVSSAVFIILANHFPENAQEWARLTNECTMSRIWGGVHFPIDDFAGKALGATVGVATLCRSE